MIGLYFFCIRSPAYRLNFCGLGKNLIIMLSQQGGGPADPGRRCGHFVRPAGVRVFAGHRVLHINKIFSEPVLRALHHVFGRIDRADGNPHFGGPMINLFLLLFPHPVFHLGGHVHEVMNSVAPIIPSFILGPIRIAHQFPDGPEMVIVVGRQDNVAVAGFHPAHGLGSVGHPAPGGELIPVHGHPRGN